MAFRSKGHGEKLSRKGEAAIVALLERGTIKAAAAAVGINESTLKRWLRDPEFSAAYRAARLQAIEQWVATASLLGAVAMHNLGQILHPSSTARPSEKIMAARAVLEYALRGHVAVSGATATSSAAEPVLSQEEVLACLAYSVCGESATPPQAGNGQAKTDGQVGAKTDGGVGSERWTITA